MNDLGRSDHRCVYHKKNGLTDLIKPLKLLIYQTTRSADVWILLTQLTFRDHVRTPMTSGAGEVLVTIPKQLYIFQQVSAPATEVKFPFVDKNKPF